MGRSSRDRRPHARTHTSMDVSAADDVATGHAKPRPRAQDFSPDCTDMCMDACTRARARARPPPQCTYICLGLRKHLSLRRRVWTCTECLADANTVAVADTGTDACADACTDRHGRDPRADASTNARTDGRADGTASAGEDTVARDHHDGLASQEDGCTGQDAGASENLVSMCIEPPLPPLSSSLQIRHDDPHDGQGDRVKYS